MTAEVIIIGGGASGAFASIISARMGRKVILFEKNERIGRKLRITGKGRCNLTNNCTNDELMNNIPVNPRFLYSAFSSFSPQDTMDFLNLSEFLSKLKEAGEFFLSAIMQMILLMLLKRK